MLTQQHLPLLVAAQRGERRAIEALLVVCRPDVRRYAQRRCLISDIDDAVQEALLVLVRKVHLLQTVAAFSSWVFQIVQRQCRRLARASMRYDPYEEELVDRWLNDRPEPQVRLDIANAFDSLPEHYRDVLLMRDFLGLSIAEIAERTALSNVAAKSRLHRARELTREYLLS